MQKFFQKLLKLSGNDKQAKAWENKSIGQAYRALFLSLASLTSVLIGISFIAVTGSYSIGVLAMAVSLPILLPSSIIILDKVQRKTLNNNVKPELLNQRKILEYEYDDALRRLEDLKIPDEHKIEMKKDLFKDFQKRLEALDQKFLE